MQNWVPKKVPKNAEPDLVKGSPKVQRWAPKRARQPTMLVLTWTMYFSGPFWGCGRFFGPESKLRPSMAWVHAASPRLCLYSMGLIHPKDSLIRSSLYQRIYRFTVAMNASKETPFHGRP